MTLPLPKWAVYYGTIKLKNGSTETYTAVDIATLYGVEDEDYLSIALTAPEPFTNAADYLTYYHLKPLPDENYFNAIERYNTENEIQWDDDFDAHQGGRWAVRPQHESDQDIG